MDRRYVFLPCKDKRHDDCATTWWWPGAPRSICSCTCHNKKEEAMDYKINIKTEVKVTGVSITLTAGQAKMVIEAMESWAGSESPDFAPWRQLQTAIWKAERGE